MSPTPTPSGGTTVSICAVADAELDQAHPDSNPGDGAELKVGFGQGQNEPFANRVLLGFDISFVPQGAAIQSAYLEMRMIAAGGLNPVEIGVYTVEQPWHELIVDWNTQPAVEANPAAQLNINSATPSVRGWSLRNLVQRWVEGSLENNGILLRGPEGGGDWDRAFDSRHYTTFCPRLVITFAPGEVIPTPTPTPTPTRTPTPQPACGQPDFGGNTFSSATAISSGQPVEEFICPSGDVDWFKLPIEGSQEVSVYLYDLPQAPDADLDVFLVNPSGGVEASSEVYGAHRGGYINHTAHVTGDWRVMVKGKGVADWSPTKTYGLRVDVKFNCDFPDEAGDTFQAATAILPSLPAANTIRKHTGYICAQKDVDYYKISVPSGQTVTIETKLTDLPADYDLFVYKPNGDLHTLSINRGTVDERTYPFTTYYPGDWRVAVKPHDGAYNNRPYTFEVILTGDADLTVEAMEVTQGIQDLSNSVLLAAGKTAVARVYVHPGAAVTSTSGVEVELHGWYYSFGWKPFPDSPLELGPREVTDAKLENTKRLITTKSFNFFLPKSWTTAGNITLKATVNPRHTIPESNYNNNDLTDTITIRNNAALNVGLVPVKTKGLVPTLKGSTDLAQMMKWLRASYPVGQINIWHIVGTYEMDHDLTEDSDEGCGPGWVDLLADLEDRYDGWTNRPPNALVYGLIDLAVPANAGGCGSSDRRSAASYLDPGGGSIIAHEIGHIHFRKHAPSDRDFSGAVSNVSCSDPGTYSEDSGYPQYTSPTGTPYNRSSIGEVGFNIFNKKTYDPEFRYDFMSYCRPRWISPYTWERIAISIPTAPKAAPVAQDNPQVSCRAP